MKNNIETIFITSTYRSGGALFTRILNVNPGIKISSGFVNYFRYYYKNYLRKKTKKNFQFLLNQFCLRSKYRHGINLNPNKLINDLNKKNATSSDFYKLICLKIFKNHNAKITGEHAVNEWRNVPNYFKIFPRGKVIILLRDPRDIVCSFKRATIAKKKDYLISIFNFVDLINYTFLLKKKYASRIKIVKFNEIKKNPKNTIKEVCKFLGIKYSSNMLNEKNYEDINGKKWDQSKVFSFSGKLKKQNIDRWKFIIEPEDLYLCEHIAKKQLKMANYEFSNNKFEKKIINKALKKIQSSSLLKSSFLKWKKTKKGNNKFPLDPKNPKNYDKKDLQNFKQFQLIK